MKSIKYILSIAFLLAVMTACKKNNFEDTSFIQTDNAPDKLSVLFDITQDNSGLVTLTPNGVGLSYYEIVYGDAITVPVKVLPGNNIQHVYAEGVYNVKIIGHSITGKITETTQQLTVSFRAPENLDFTITIDPANRFKINVTATALYETLFKIYFGDVPNEVPQSFLEGAVISHTYASVGTFNVRVVALSGGTATAQLIKPVTIVNPLLLPITFESATVDYTFTNFDGGNVTTINNPYATGINTSAKVGKMVKNAGQVWGGSLITLGAPIDFSAGKVFRMKVYSPRVGAKVLLKVENTSNGGINFEKEVTTTVANTWEDLVFDFNAINTANAYHKIVLIFELGTQGDGSPNFTFLFDDIRLTNQLPVSLLTLPVTFDDPSVNYAMIDFGNNQTTDDVDPTNAANKVKKTVKPNGAQTWAGTTIGPGFTSRIPFSATATQMSVRLYAPAAGLPIRLKVEDRTNPTISVETEALTTTANGWQTLVFDFANQAAGTAAINFANNYDMASIFFDFGTAGNGKVFYWDDIKFLPTNLVTGIALPLDFENGGLTYTFTNFDGGNTTVIANTQSGGINTSSKVAKMVKSAGQVWGGSWIALAAPINFSASRTFKMKVFSPRVGAKVLLKVENLTNGGISFEKEVSTTFSNAWEELSFDFNAINTANSYQKIVVIFDLGSMGDGTSNYTFLFDDIKLN